MKVLLSVWGPDSTTSEECVITRIVADDVMQLPITGGVTGDKLSKDFYVRICSSGDDPQIPVGIIQVPEKDEFKFRTSGDKLPRADEDVRFHAHGVPLL